jgi:[ribosomal protein S5]-alanine N-acetyltransferase
VIDYLGTPKIETDRLILRRMDLSDAQKVFDHWLSDERVSDNRVNAAHRTVSETIERVAKIVSDYANKEFCWWAIERKADGELIGEIDLYDFDNATENCEVSYSIGYQWWNQGYGTEALRAVVDFGFRYMNIHKIAAAHNTDNPASGKVIGKAGMEQEGTIRHMIRNAKGQYKDCAIYGLLQEDYVNKHISDQTSILKLNDIAIDLRVTTAQLLKVFNNAWSLKSSSKWSRENPAKGQCGVTSLVVNDILGDTKNSLSGRMALL